MAKRQSATRSVARNGVSIIVPAFNAAATIAETLRSICAQTWTQWEAIVVDDGSTDETSAVVAEFVGREPRISLLRQDNGGEASARNTGLARATRDWLLFLDADDWISPVHLERMMSALAAHPELGAVHCASVRVAGDGTFVSDNYEPPDGDLFPTLARRAAFPIHACIVRRSIVVEAGRFDPSLRTSPDWDLWQRVARMGTRFGAVREVLAYYRMRPQSASLDGARLFADGLRVLKQGHAPDPRVSRPHPDHAQGAPPEGVLSQQYYLLCWCAGLMIGAGQSGVSILSTVRDQPYANLYADAVARCLFESVPLPTCRTPASWDALWPSAKALIAEFLPALEAQSQTAGLAASALTELKTLIGRSSAASGSIFTELERAVVEGRARIATLESDSARLSESCRTLQQQVNDLEHVAARLRQLHSRLTDDLRQAQLREQGQREQIAGLGHQLHEAYQQAATLTQSLTAAMDQLQEWQRLAVEREQLLAALDQHAWVRFGRRVRALAETARQPLPEEPL
jgi:hypothetical protein